MKNKLIEILKNLSGRIFTLGIIEKDLIDIIVKNDNLTDFLILSFKKRLNYNSNEVKEIKKSKIKKVSKKNKKNKFDYSIFEISDIEDKINIIINDSILFTKKKIFFYGDITKIEIEKLVKKYRRYNFEIKLEKYKDNKFILEIKLKKYSKIKRKIYQIIDFFNYIYESISAILVS